MVSTTDTEIAMRPVTPWWYWLIGVLGVLWSMGGAYDYIMTRTKNAEYLAEIPAPLMEYYNSMSPILDFTWPLAVWAGLLGWVLMLARSRFAVPVFLVSLVSMFINFGYMLVDGGLALQAEHMGAAIGWGMTIAVIALGIFAVWYSRLMRARGILR